MRVGLFFGSFNPIHMGHMIIAQTMLDSGHIDELWFVISPQNPFKKNKNLLHEFDRLDMVDAAISENSKFRTSDIEFNLPKPSYTAHTLAVLSEKNPDKEFSLIIGGDNLASFHKWKNYQTILEHHELLVYPRPADQKPQIEITDRIHFVEAPLLDISATFIRSNIKNGHSIKYLVPTEVEDFIARKKFYQ
ncbi:MAG: nicotinate (nicotinamide) nucleotide adenylyltransferase [Reichenbachiella sp.]|uniref:nicotinate (nicotinamide) nucleotide adenylyltransferase n=1 Tax=Reichenbachiella sp. TaxID=2184521 RepID=UPI002965EFFA|nr:nicotinate (nicotinamide) nucleotide adenylyltransferase [Reichenbachiella sp.]MDW3211858.1 nicotinate (nicotinamide) nucleotide adenylyltransferase [Reichenbachiella sp.]